MTYDLFSQVCHREKNRMQIYIQTTCARQKTGFATQIFAITIFLIDDRMQKFPKLRHFGGIKSSQHLVRCIWPQNHSNPTISWEMTPNLICGGAHKQKNSQNMTYWQPNWQPMGCVQMQ